MIKFKIGRHWLVKALVGVALVATIGFSPHNRVLAVRDGELPKYENVEGKDGVSFNGSGDVYFQTRDKAATHDTKYRTLGFYASTHRTGENTKVNQLNPRWYFKRSEFVPVSSDVDKDGYMVTKYKIIGGASLADKIFSNKDYSGVSKVYFHAVMDDIVPAGVTKTGPYYSLNDWKNGHDWDKKDSFDQHYNIEVGVFQRPVRQRMVIDGEEYDYKGDPFSTSSDELIHTILKGDPVSTSNDGLIYTILKGESAIFNIGGENDNFLQGNKKGNFPLIIKKDGVTYKLTGVKYINEDVTVTQAVNPTTSSSFMVEMTDKRITVAGYYKKTKSYKIRQKFNFKYLDKTKTHTNCKGEYYSADTNGVIKEGEPGVEVEFKNFEKLNFSSVATLDRIPKSSSDASASYCELRDSYIPDFIYSESDDRVFQATSADIYSSRKLLFSEDYEFQYASDFLVVADKDDVTVSLNYKETYPIRCKYNFYTADGTKYAIAGNGYYYDKKQGLRVRALGKSIFAMDVGGTAVLSEFPKSKGTRASKCSIGDDSEFPAVVTVGSKKFGLSKIVKYTDSGEEEVWNKKTDKPDSLPVRCEDTAYTLVGFYYEENPCSVRQKFNLYGEKEEVELGVDGKTYDGETNGTVKSDLEEGEKVTFSITDSKVSSSKLEPLSFPTKITHNGTTYKLTGIKSYLNGKKPENKDFGVAGGTIKTVKGFTTLVGFYKEVKEKDKAPIEMKVKVELYDEKGTLLKTKAWWFNGTSLQDGESTIDKAVIGDSITFKKGTSLKKYNYPETLETELGEGELQKIQIVDTSGTKLKEGTTSVSYKVPKSGLTGIAIYKVTQPTTKGEVRMKLKVRTFDSKGNLLETEDYYYNGKTTSTTLAKLTTKKIGESVTFKKGTKLKSYEFPAVFKDGEFVSITGYKNGKKDTTSDSVVTAKVPAGYYTAVAIYDKKETVPPDTSSDSSGFSKREYLDASPAAKIDADSEGAEEYNAKYFVPSSETLYTWVTSKDYLYKYTYKAVKQTKTYNSVARKKFILQWTEQVGTEKPTEPGKLGEPIYADYENVVIKQVSVPFTFVYQYYKLESLAVYKIDKAVVKNGAFPDEQTLTPVSYIEPTCTYDVIADHVVEPSFAKEVELPSQTIGSHSVSGETSRPSAPEINKSEAVSAILAQSGNTTAKIRNSSLTINGTVCMDSKWKSGTFNSSKTEVSLACSIPKNPQSPKTTDKAVLFKSGIQIPPAKQNAIYDAEQATVYYTTVASYNNIEDSLSFECNTNQIGVLTPVICEPLIEDAKKYCQLAQVDNSRSQLVLGEKFTVHLPVVGEHLDQLGYKTRSYRKYVRTRTIKFPFDVVYEGKTIKANTTIKVANNTDVLEFIVPEWVTEGNYEVEFATIAINNPTNGTSQLKANTVRANSIATNTLKVCVSGRLYGLSLFDVSDYPLWESVFRKENSIKLTGTTYTVGTKDRNGNATTRKELYTLPMTTGKHPTTKNQGLLKTGYTMQFKLNTIGTMIGPNDSVKITPEFYHLSADGKKLQAVDVYYSETIGKKYYPLVQVGSKTDKGNSITYRMSDSSHGINKAVAKETARLLGVSLKSIWSKAYSIGSHYQLNLPNSTRLLTGTSKYTGNADEIKKSGQTWFFEWYLPSKTHVVKKGYDVQSVLKSKGIDFKENFWLKDGTLLVRFRIQTYQNGKLHLDYYNTPSGCMNEWATERSATTCKVRKATYTLQDGDVMFFRLDRSAADDYQSGGTH